MKDVSYLPAMMTALKYTQWMEESNKATLRKYSGNLVKCCRIAKQLSEITERKAVEDIPQVESV